jgi:transcriptional regulator with XRE-family HTH domain
VKYLAKNLKFLREKRNWKQSEMPDIAGVGRTTWNMYESGASKPSLDDFIRIVKLFDVSETDILHVDLSKQGNLIPQKKGIEKQKNGNLKGNGKGNLSLKNNHSEGQLSVLSEAEMHYRLPQVITVDSAGNENVVMVPVRARAGYLNGYADPVFIEKLPAFRLPGLNTGTFRLFEVEGLSMYPTLQSGDIVIGQYVDQLRVIRDDRIYVVVTKNDGLVVKRLLNRIEKDGKLILKSDNYKERESYPTIICDPADVIEVWYATGFISRQMRPPAELYNRFIDLEGRFTLLEDLVRKSGLK